MLSLYAQETYFSKHERIPISKFGEIINKHLSQTLPLFWPPSYLRNSPNFYTHSYPRHQLGHHTWNQYQKGWPGIFYMARSMLYCTGIFFWLTIFLKGHSRPLFIYFRLFNTAQYFFCQWLDSNRRPLALEVTALPTEPQPLPSYDWFRQIALQMAAVFATFLMLKVQQLDTAKMFN